MVRVNLRHLTYLPTVSAIGYMGLIGVPLTTQSCRPPVATAARDDRAPHQSWKATVEDTRLGNYIWQTMVSYLAKDR